MLEKLVRYKLFSTSKVRQFGQSGKLTCPHTLQPSPPRRPALLATQAMDRWL